MSESNPNVEQVLEGLGGTFEAFQAAYKRRLDEIEKRMNRPDFGMFGGGDDADAAEAIETLSTFVRSGKVEMRSMSAGSDPDGGYTVGPEVSRQITATIAETSPFRQAGVRVETITKGDSFEELSDRGTAEIRWVGETTAPADTDTPQLGKLSVPVHELEAEPKATQQLLEDSDRDVAAWLTGKVADAFGIEENRTFLLGDGITKPRGLLTYPTAATADATRAWGQIEHLATGVNGAFAASNPADILFDAESAMKPAYRNGAVWLVGKDTLRAIRKFKDSTGQYLWQPRIAAAATPTLLGYPVYECADMPALGTGSLSVAFVNLARAYIVVDRLGVQILRDPFTARPYVKFITRRRVGGGAANFEAVKLIKFGS